MSRASSVSVVIPVYNSAACLPLLVERLARVLGTSRIDFEVLLVDGGSRDGSWNVIRELAASRPFVRGIRLMRNFGQHHALLCGIRAARCELVVTMDDDLQNPPEEIPKLLGRVGEDWDVVYGTPENQEHGLWRNLASTISKVFCVSIDVLLTWGTARFASIVVQHNPRGSGRPHYTFRPLLRDAGSLWYQRRTDSMRNPQRS